MKHSIVGRLMTVVVALLALSLRAQETPRNSSSDVPPDARRGDRPQLPPTPVSTGWVFIDGELVNDRDGLSDSVQPKSVIDVIQGLSGGKV